MLTSNTKLSRHNRLPTSESFDRVLKKPNINVTSGPLIFIIKNNGLEVSRLGLIVPKKKLSKATHRNYLKRQLREVFRQSKHGLKGYDLVIILRAVIDPDGLSNCRRLILRAMNNLMELAMSRETAMSEKKAMSKINIVNERSHEL